MTYTRLLVLSALVGVAACGGGSAEAKTADSGETSEAVAPAGTGETTVASTAARWQACEVVAVGTPLPDGAHESSGLARSLRDPGLFWTHNDAGNDPELFAFDEDGSLAGRVRVTGASLVDWEDMEAGRCDGEPCLYLGDIGDNDGERPHITIYRVPEPAPGASETAAAEALHARFPDGARDAESLFLGPDGDLFVVTKGRRDGIALYRYASPRPSAEPVVMERVRTLFPEPGHEDDRVTAASATPDGRWVGIRTYRTLYLYPTDDLVAGRDVEPVEVDLSVLAEAQGEAVVLGEGGSVWVSSEADDGDGPRLSRLRCELPGHG